MFDRSLVTSNFDTETLISEKYLTYLLLAQIEAGYLKLEFDVLNWTVRLHPPADEDYQRLYGPSLDPPLPSPEPNSFRCRLLPGEASGFYDLAFTPDGNHLLTRSEDNMVRIWDLQTRTQDEQAAFELPELVIGSAFNAAGTQIATASVDHKVRIWDLQTKMVVLTLTGHTKPVECVAFSADGQRLVSGSFDQTVRVWDLQNGTLLHTLSGHVGRVKSVAFNHAGTQVVSGGETGSLRLWDAQSGTLVHELQGHSGPVNCAVFSLTDNHIVSGSEDKTVRLWNPATATTVRTYTEHQDAVDWVDVGSFHLISASRDKTLKLWGPNSTASLHTISKQHRSEITRVRFAGAGPRNASVTAGGSIRIWDDVATDKTTEIRMDFMHVDAFITIINHSTNKTFEGMIGLIVYLALYADRSDKGLEFNHILRLTFARLDDGTKTLLESQGYDVEFIEKMLREYLDRDLPLGIAQGQQVQQIRMRKFFEGDYRTLGIYVDLALHSGPGNQYLAPRGNVDLAKCFREPKKAIAFATSPGLYELLGPDAKFRRAELSPGSSEYRYPFREDMSDSSSKELGTIDSISVEPSFLLVNNIPIAEILDIKIDLTYTESDPDLGFTAHFYFNPKRNADGIVEWESRLDIDFGLLATLLFVIAGLTLALLFTFLTPIGIGFWLMAGTIASLVGQAVAEQLVSKQAAEKVDEESQASVLDSLPFRLLAAVRRWDPFYETQHQIVAKLDESMVIDDLGMAFAAEQVVLDKQPILQPDIAPYEALRENGEIVGIHYEVPDFARIASSTTPDAKGPGVDRMDFVRSDPVNRPTIITLTLGQIEERKAQKRLLVPIVLDARRINMFQGQIDRLLCTTWRVRTEQRDRLIGEFQQRTLAEIMANELPAIEQKATVDLTAKLGRPPTAEELAKEVELRVQSLIEERQKVYEDGRLRDDLHPKLAPLLHFDLKPEELVSLQQEHGVFSLDGKEIIVRENQDGSHTPYYRDHPDRDPRDNLLSLPHYRYPYVPPPPP